MMNERNYRLHPAPPRWALQEYITAWLRTHDDQYLAWFLHYYEPTLNDRAGALASKYFMQEHASDIKQAYVLGLLKALQCYDPEQGAPFLVFKERYAQREVLDYIRCARSGFTAQSLTEFGKLRQAMAIWSEKYRRSGGKGVLEAIAAEMEETPERVTAILQGGLLNENAVSLYRSSPDADEEQSVEESIADPASDPAVLWPRMELHDRLWEAFSALDYEEQHIVAAHLGFCPDCGSTVFMDRSPDGQRKKKPMPRMMFTDIATAHGYSSARTVQRKYQRALEKMRKMLVGDDSE